MDSSPTFYFAPEIENQLLSICWHNPERIATIQKELDPTVHLSQPHLRHILEALSVAYRELGCVDFTVVVQVLRELDRLEDCGGLPGVNFVYALALHAYQERAHQQALFDHYLQMLKSYALARQAKPPLRVYRFLELKGTLQANKTKHWVADPDFVGEARGNGRLYDATAWTSSEGTYLNFRLIPKS